MRDLPPLARAPLLALGFIALAFGIAGGLARLGVGRAAPAAIAWHGALMAGAFFGTLISLERAVAVGRLWTYLAPLASGIGGLVLLAGVALPAFILFVLAAAVFVAASALVFLKQRALHTGVLVLGALSLLVGNAGLAAQAPLDAVALAWIAFFALTIGAERLELSRLVRPPQGARRAFMLNSLALLGAALAAPWWSAAALRVAGVLLAALAVWLTRYDIASRTVRASGLTRYIAVCLLAGYAWLAFGGLALAAAGSGAPDLWDAALHAVMLGFVFSMVLGHAPVILPAVLRVAFPYSAMLYAPLVLLHASLAVRIAGDLFSAPAWRAAGAAGNAAAIVLFVATAGALVALRRTSAR